MTSLLENDWHFLPVKELTIARSNDPSKKKASSEDVCFLVLSRQWSLAEDNEQIWWTNEYYFINCKLKQIKASSCW